jgi:hypothetical protein
VRPGRAAAAGAYRLHIADPLTLAFDDVDGGSGIGNQVDPDVLAELLQFHDSELGPSILELLTDPDSTLRIGVESDIIATESSTDEQKRQRAIYYKKVAETIHPHLERFFRAEMYRRCREAAPNLCHHLQLQPIVVPQVQRSPALTALAAKLAKLLPVYTKLADLRKAELDSENQRTRNQTLMDKARRDLDMLQPDAGFDDYDDFDFVSGWTEEETKDLLTAVKRELAKLGTDSRATSRSDALPWDEIAAAFAGHDGASCKGEYIRWRADNAITRATKNLTGIEAQLKSMQTRNATIIQELTVVDMPTSASANTILAKNDPSAKKAKLTLNLSALLGACNPRCLPDLMRAFTSFCDQLPGSYSLTRCILSYISTEFLTGNTTASFPQARNKYSLDLPDTTVLSAFIDQESRSLARILASDYPTLVEDMCQLRNVNSDTPAPGMYQAEKTCGIEMILATFHKHSGKNQSFVRALRAAICSIGGILANKKDTLSTLRAFMKNLIRVAKRMTVRIDWDEGVRPLLSYLRDQSSTVYIEIIQEYCHPTVAERYDALLVMEKIISQMIAVCEQNLVAADIRIDQTSVAGKAIAFAAAMAEINHLTGEECVDALMISVAPTRQKQQLALAASPSTSTGSGTGRSAKALALTTPEDALKYAISDKCPNFERHIFIEKYQPSMGSSWKCQHEGCNNPVPDDQRIAYQKLRLGECVENYWKAAMCTTHFVHHLVKDMPGKGGEVIRMMTKNASRKKIRLLEDWQKELYKKMKPSTDAGTNAVIAPSTSGAPSPAAGDTGTDAAARFERFQQFERFEKQQQAPTNFILPGDAEFRDLQMKQSQLAEQVKAASLRRLNC